MEQYELTDEGYIRLKQQIKDRLNATVDNFIAIGYYLKQVRDSGAYTRDGYPGINDFAKGEYGLDASTTSRFMAMNTAYSEGGNSLIIRAQYKAIAEARSGKSLLEEMLTMSEEDRELVTEETTVRQVREIKALEREEAEAEKAQKEAELPLVAQGGPEAQGNAIERNVRLMAADDEDGEESDALTATLKAFLKENLEIYQRVKAGILTPELFAEAVCPSGARTYRHKVNMLFLYTYQGGVRFRVYEGGKPTIESYSYDKLLEMAQGIENSPAPAAEESAATPQEENTAAADASEDYVPIPGQCSVLPDVQPAALEEPAKAAEQAEVADNDAEDKKSIWAKEVEARLRRRLRVRRYTREDVDAAGNFFREELERMERSGVEHTAKFRHYQMAYDLIANWHFD
ncbi:MAG: hypothetical protein LUE96_07355 [Lachnospiraceae bacterium]|nr:hypothetical protein [Lachnospiraceae bacterium]